ncbi:protein kinase [Duganella sp. CY15W]|uniref:serine/threonine-protein kinase n=1 Tax=Duganella sp. CY15W TaxID=2692172 RepID=UPI00137074E5|nr:protein kinase [Duganella sp. CY15W]
MSVQYEIGPCLGAGGFGEVFEAWDHQLQRSVAIKRLRNFGDATHSEHLLREARLAASLKHAAFVKIYALEQSPQGQAIVMELVEGQTLKQLLSQAPLPEKAALAIMRQLADAMCEAHDSGLVHGDLKPSNLMQDVSGTVRILDFGLAAQFDPQATMSLHPSEQQGTIAYMAPERLQGAPLRPQSDIYALGVILYELLTGSRPFADLNGLALAAAQMQSCSDHWPYPDHVRPALVQLVRALTAVPADKRVQTMQKVRELLAQVDGPNFRLAPAAPSRLRRSRLALWGGALVLMLGGAWLATPHLPTSGQLHTLLEPYSEAQEMQQGLQALKQWDRPGATGEAEAHFAKVLEHTPGSAAAAAGLAIAYGFRYNSDHMDDIWLRKASAAAQQALQLNPQLALAHVAQASVLIWERKPEPALAAFNQALSLDPANLNALDGKILALRRLRHYDSALQTAEDGARRYPRERVFADHIGSIHYAQAHYPQAEQAFRHSIQLQPDAVVAYANLAAALASQNKIDDALHILQQGLEVRPSAWLYGNLGNVLFLREDYQGAAVAFAAAVSPDKGNPADYLGWANLADTLLWLPGRAEDARRAYARAIELLAPRLARAPQDATLASQMGMYASRTGNREQALNLLQQSLTLAPKDAEVQFRAALGYELLGERKPALAAIHRALRLGYPAKFIEATPELVALRRDTAYQQP